MIRNVVSLHVNTKKSDAQLHISPINFQSHPLISQSQLPKSSTLSTDVIILIPTHTSKLFQILSQLKPTFTSKPYYKFIQILSQLKSTIMSKPYTILLKVHSEITPRISSLFRTSHATCCVLHSNRLNCSRSSIHSN